MNYIKVFICFVLWISFPALNHAQTELSYFKKVKLQIPEPSDICLSFNGKSLFIVSDQGAIFETDLNGKIIRSRKTGLNDCEAVAIKGSTEILVVEERNRKIKQIKTSDFTDVSSVTIPLKGKPNAGFEAIASNGQQWYLFSEKDPTLLIILDNKLNEISRKKVNVPGDISGATYHDGQLWLISDEMRSIYIMNNDLTTISQSYKINVDNAEGIVFIDNGTIAVISDKDEGIYFFKSPLLNKSGN